MTSAIAQHGETLAPLMRRAGFRYVFLGIENVLADDLLFLRARAKNLRREGGRPIGNAALEAVEHLHRHGMFVVGGLIVGNPDDTRAAIDANLAFAREHMDWPYIQHPTPYPRTPMTRDFVERGLVVSDRLEEYDGTTAVVRTAHLDAEEVEFMRWRAERWMKVRHMPAAFRHDPWFMARHARRMFAHTFRGSTWRTWTGSGRRAGGVQALQSVAPTGARVRAGTEGAGLSGRVIGRTEVRPCCIGASVPYSSLQAGAQRSRAPTLASPAARARVPRRATPGSAPSHRMPTSS